MHNVKRQLIGISEQKETVKTIICETMDIIAQEMSKRNPVYTVKPILVGSQKENTRPFLPDEFDFLLVLTHLQSLVDIKTSIFGLMFGEIAIFKCKGMDMCYTATIC